MIPRLDETEKIKGSNRKIDSLTTALLKANIKAEKVSLEYKKLEKNHNALVEHLPLMNTKTFASSKSLKNIECKKVKGMYDDKDDFGGTPTALSSEVPQWDYAAPSDTQDAPTTSSKKKPYRKGMMNNKITVDTPIKHTSGYAMLPKFRSLYRLS